MQLNIWAYCSRNPHLPAYVPPSFEEKIILIQQQIDHFKNWCKNIGATLLLISAPLSEDSNSSEECLVHFLIKFAQDRGDGGFYDFLCVVDPEQNWFLCDEKFQISYAMSEEK